MFCIKCGNRVNDNDKFCMKCGNNLQNENKPKEKTALPSLILGIVSILGAFVANIFIIPISVVGLILGLIAEKKSKFKTAGIILNIIGVIMGIAVFIFLTLVVMMGRKEIINKAQRFVDEVSSIEGTWSCTEQNDYYNFGVSENKKITFSFNNNYSFSKNTNDPEMSGYYTGTYFYYSTGKGRGNLTLTMNDNYTDDSRNPMNRTEKYSVTYKDNNSVIFYNITEGESYVCTKIWSNVLEDDITM